MLIKERKLKGVFEITPEPHEDNRGFFMRTYDEKIFMDHGLHRNWVQENHSYSKKKGTLRGLHFQFPPHVETKLIRAVSGEIFMAFVDLRKSLSTFGKWDSMIISESNKKLLYIPRGLALGMCTLTDNCTLLYKMDNYYAQESAGTIKWDDPDIGIDWPITNLVLSEKDSKAEGFKEFVKTHRGLEV
jgi:dTDP-4-dehydrorhamnose 3,5-epimerase